MFKFVPFSSSTFESDYLMEFIDAENGRFADDKVLLSGRAQDCVI